MNQQAQHIIDYITRELIRTPVTTIDVATPLVSTGLIDSFALIDILTKLEDVTQMKIPAGKIGARDMDTVEMMLSTAKRVGRPRQ